MLATLDEFKSYLKISWTDQDVLLTIFLEWANQMILTYIGRKIESTDYTDFINWNAQQELLLPNYPVSSLTKISRNIWTLETPDWQEVSKINYMLEWSIWKIFFVSPLIRWFQNYKIEYNAWFEVIPADLKLACLKFASKYFNMSSTDWIKWESVNWDRLDFDVSEIPSDILVILNNYRNIYV